MVGNVLKWAAGVLAALALAIGVFFVVELARLYVLLWRIDPIWANLYKQSLLVAALLVLLLLFVKIRSYAMDLRPPRFPTWASEHSRMRRYCKYLRTCAKRLAENPHLSQEHQLAALGAARNLREVLRAHPLNDDLIRAIANAENEVLAPALAALTAKADAYLNAQAQKLVLETCVTPFHALWPLVVSYRSLRVTQQVLSLFYPRPLSPRCLWRLYRDVAGILMRARAFAVAESLHGAWTSAMPVSSPVTERMGQGLVAGLVTIFAGHAMAARCAAYSGWQPEREVKRLREQLASDLHSFRNLFALEIVPALRKLIAPAPLPTDQGGRSFWDCVATSLDAAVHLAPGAASVWMEDSGDAESPQANAGRRRRRVWRRRRASSTARVLHTFAQRLYYTLRAPRFRGPNS